MVIEFYPLQKIGTSPNPGTCEWNLIYKEALAERIQDLRVQIILE